MIDIPQPIADLDELLAALVAERRRIGAAVADMRRRAGVADGADPTIGRALGLSLHHVQAQIDSVRHALAHEHEIAQGGTALFTSG